MARGFNAVDGSFAAFDLNSDLLSYSKIFVTLRPDDKDGLIVHYGSSSVDFLELVLSDGFVQFRFELGTGMLLLNSSTKLSLYTWHTIRAERRRQQGKPSLLILCLAF